MASLHRARLCLAGVCLLAVCAGSGAGDVKEKPAALDRILPGTTRHFLVSNNLGKTVQGFVDTQFGRLLDDERLLKFKEDLREQMKKRQGLTFLGLTLDDLSDISSGEVGWAVVEVTPGKRGEVLFVDAAKNLEDLAVKLRVWPERLAQDGWTQRQETVGGVKVTVQERTVPATGKVQRLAYFVKGGRLVVASNLDLLAEVLRRWDGKATGSLAELPAYRAIAERTPTAGKETVYLRFFVDYLSLIDLQAPPEGTKSQKTGTADLRRVGLDGIKGIGGFVTFGGPDHDLFFRVAVHAPPPHKKSLGLFHFRTSAALAPEPWVPAKIGLYSASNLDLGNAFDCADSLFDTFAVDHDAGAFQAVVESIKNDPDGPRVDLRKEIFGHLAIPLTFFTDYAEPLLERKATRFVASAPLKDLKVGAAAVRRFLEGDPRLQRKEVRGQVIWVIRTRRSPEDPTLVPRLAVSVTEGRLFLSSHADLLEEIYTREKRPGLAQFADFTRCQKELDRLGGPQVAGRLFARTAEDFRLTYEMMRTNQLQLNSSLYSRLLLSVPGLEGLKFNGDLLPSYDQVSRYFTALGASVENHPQGWDVFGFYLKPETKPAR